MSLHSALYGTAVRDGEVKKAKPGNSYGIATVAIPNGQDNDTTMDITEGLFQSGGTHPISYHPNLIPYEPQFGVSTKRMKKSPRNRMRCLTRISDHQCLMVQTVIAPVGAVSG
ncbi:MAG: hypothetical protein WBX25_28860 [Rhodomicrobium sp.]